MPNPEALQHLAGRLALAGFHLFYSALNSANRVYRFLKSLRVLNDQFCFAVDGENFWTSSLFKTAQMGARIPLEICQRADVLQVDHNIQFTVLTMIPLMAPTIKPVIALWSVPPNRLDLGVGASDIIEARWRDGRVV